MVVASFFNPEWKDLGVLRGYGRVFEVNTAWSMYLALFHAFYSIALPIFFTTAYYAAKAPGPWLGASSSY